PRRPVLQRLHPPLLVHPQNRRIARCPMHADPRDHVPELVQRFRLQPHRITHRQLVTRRLHQNRRHPHRHHHERHPPPHSPHLLQRRTHKHHRSQHHEQHTQPTPEHNPPPTPKTRKKPDETHGHANPTGPQPHYSPTTPPVSILAQPRIPRPNTPRNFSGMILPLEPLHTPPPKKIHERRSTRHVRKT